MVELLDVVDEFFNCPVFGVRSHVLNVDHFLELFLGDKAVDVFTCDFVDAHVCFPLVNVCFQLG